MARTYYISDALNTVGRQIPRISQDGHSEIIVNTAISYIWRRYDWPVTMKPLPPFWLVPLVQDYFQVVPADYYGLRRANLVQLTDDRPFIWPPMGITKHLGPDTIEGLPRSIVYNPANRTFRLFPRPSVSMAAPEWLIIGEYKYQPPTLTANELNETLIPWDDLYFDVFCAGLRWAFFTLMGDPRAGQKQLTRFGVPQYTGEFAAFEDALQRMAEDEGLNLGTPVVHPSEALVTDINWGTIGLTGF